MQRSSPRTSRAATPGVFVAHFSQGAPIGSRSVAGGIRGRLVRPPQRRQETLRSPDVFRKVQELNEHDSSVQICAQQAIEFSRCVLHGRNETYQSAEGLPAFLAQTAGALLVSSGLAIIRLWHTRRRLKEPMTPGSGLEVELPRVIPLDGAGPSAVRSGTSRRQAAVLR